MKRFFLLSFLVVLFCFGAHATAQYPDKIVFKGKTYKLHTNPLEHFFEQFPDRRPRSGIMSTALWRGYIATFEIKNNSLVVKDIEIQVSKEQPDGDYQYSWKSVLDEVFPNEEECKVDWFSGILILPYGKMKNYVHMGYGSTYSKYILLEILEGTLTEDRKYNNKEFIAFKNRQFEAYKQTDEYQQTLAELLKEPNYTEEFVEGFLKNFITNYTSRFLDD